MEAVIVTMSAHVEVIGNATHTQNMTFSWATMLLKCVCVCVCVHACVLMLSSANFVVICHNFSWLITGGRYKSCSVYLVLVQDLRFYSVVAEGIVPPGCHAVLLAEYFHVF